MFFFPERAGRLALALMALCCASITGAQPRMTADEAVERALSREQWQQEWRAPIDMARGDVTLARTLPNPSLVLSREQLGDTATADGEETSVMLSQPLELGGRRGARIRAAEAGLAVAEVASIRDQRRARAEVLRAYYATVAAEQHRQARAKALTALESLTDIAGKRREGGDLSGYEARRIQQAAGEAHAAHADAEAAARAARAALVAWAGPDADTAILDDGIPLPALPAAAGAGSTDLDLAAAERARAEAELAAASSLSLPVTVGFGRTRVRQGGWSDDGLRLEVGVGLPLFDRRQGERARARAALSLAEARHEREQRQLAIRSAALLEQARVLAASAERITSQLLPEATALTALARASFSEGELDLIALLDAYDTEAALVERGLSDRLRALDAALALEALAPSPGH